MELGESPRAVGDADRPSTLDTPASPATCPAGEAAGEAPPSRHFPPTGRGVPEDTDRSSGDTSPARYATPGRAPGSERSGTRPSRRAGRNLPVAVAVGVSLGGLVLLTLLTVKATFLIFAGVVEGLALWEFRRALRTRGVRPPVAPVVLGGAAMITSEYWLTDRVVLAELVLTVVAVLAWRLPGGVEGYLRDVTAAVFAVGYLPLAAVFMAAMLAQPDGARRVLVFIILTVCSDIGGYAAGVTLGRHPMAPVISPNKTWEGFAGSVVACLVAGAIALPLLLNGRVWQGIVAGAAAVVAATVGDLAESMIKRDLAVKDMGSVLPGHGGVLDRIDSLLVCAPVMWIVLDGLLPVH